MITKLIPSHIFVRNTAGHPIRVTAEFRLPKNEAIKGIRVKVGRNVQTIKLPPSPDTSTYSFEFTTGAGFKIAYIQAQTASGAYKTIATRYVWARRKALNPRPAPLKIASACDPTEKLTLPRLNQTIEVSIVIPAYNQWSYTHACIKSIIKAEPSLWYEVILADDKSSDDTLKASEFVENLIISRPPENLGFLLNCNLAASKARGQYLYFLNNDTQLQAGAISTLLNTLKARPDAGMVGSKLIYPDGRLQEAGSIVWNDASAWNFGRLQDPSLPEFNYLKETDYCSGASILIPRNLWIAVGGFSKEFAPAYCEDSDLAYKIRAHGLKIYYQPKSVVVHFEGVSCGISTGSGIKAYQVANTRRLREKWSSTLAMEAFTNAQNIFQARDRSRFKKVVVVIDHYIPKPDRDAGSRTMLQFLQMLVAEAANVKFIGANFYYDPDYADNLQSLGIEILAGTYYRDNWETWFAANGPLVHAVLFSRPHITEKFLPVVKEHCPTARLVYYGHDLHFLREQREYALTRSPDTEKNVRDWLRREGDILGLVDINLTPSHEEAAIVKQRWPKTHSIVTPAWFWRDWPAAVQPWSERRGFLFVGGFGHPPNVDGLLWLLEHIWPSIRASLPDAVLHIVGSSASPELTSRTDPGIVFHGFLSDESLGNLYQTARVALVPLRFGAGVKGKTVEAMRLGLPLTSTSIGLEGLAGLPPAIHRVDDPAHFTADALSLYQDQFAWAHRQRSQSDYVRENFSWEKATSVFRETFDLTE